MNFFTIAANGYIKGSLGGITEESIAKKVSTTSQALGNIGFAFPFSLIVLEIQVIQAYLSSVSNLLFC